MTIQELNNILDVRIAEIIGELKSTTDLDSIQFGGTVSGFLIKTGIHLAARGGCPNKVLRTQIAETIKEAYKYR